MARNVFKLFNKVGEIFEIYVSEMASKAFKLSTTFGEIFEIYMFEMNRNVFKLSTGENFEIYIFEMARIEFKLSKFPDNSRFSLTQQKSPANPTFSRVLTSLVLYRFNSPLNISVHAF